MADALAPIDELALLRAENERLRRLLEARWPVAPVDDLRAPFPYFGNKRRAACLIWAALGGDVPNLVIGFAGSLAELLARPAPGKVETVNDASGLVANFWRAVQRAPDGVAAAADHPVIEIDLHAWHERLTAAAEDLRARLFADPGYFDAELAGRWAWGASAWLGGGWCDGKLWRKRPEISGGSGRARTGHGVHSGDGRGGERLHASRPHLGGGNHGSPSRNMGVHRGQLPSLSGSDGTGVGVGSGGRRAGLVAWMRALADRLRFVRIICGDFARVLTPAVTTSHGLTGVILDPPYTPAERCKRLYEVEDGGAAARAAAWARENGENPLLRIVLCGYAGEHDMPASWRCIPWRAYGGYGLQAHGRGRENRDRERLWLSPHCLRYDAPQQLDLVGGTHG